MCSCECEASVRSRQFGDSSGIRRDPDLRVRETVTENEVTVSKSVEVMIKRRIL